MKVSDNFVIQEFVPPEIMANFGKKSLWYIDARLFDIAEALRQLCGAPLRINNWHTGGDFRYRGFRPPMVKQKDWATFSQHYLGRAFDSNAKGLTPRQMFDIVIGNKELFIRLGLTTIEDPAYTPTWLHLDVRPRIPGVHPENDFLIVKP